MDDVELDNERHKREEQERRAKRKVRKEIVNFLPSGSLLIFVHILCLKNNYLIYLQK